MQIFHKNRLKLALWFLGYLDRFGRPFFIFRKEVKMTSFICVDLFDYLRSNWTSHKMTQPKKDFPSTLLSRYKPEITPNSKLSKNPMVRCKNKIIIQMQTGGKCWSSEWNNIALLIFKTKIMLTFILFSLQNINYDTHYVPRPMKTIYYEKIIKMDKNPIKTVFNVCDRLIGERVSFFRALFSYYYLLIDSGAFPRVKFGNLTWCTWDGVVDNTSA